MGKIFNSDFVSLRRNKFKNLDTKPQECKENFLIPFFTSLLEQNATKYGSTAEEVLSSKQNLKTKMCSGPVHVLGGWVKEKEVPELNIRSSIHFIFQYHLFKLFVFVYFLNVHYSCLIAHVYYT